MGMSMRPRQTSRMINEFHVEGIEKMPVFLISSEDPRNFSMTDLVSGVSLQELLARVTAPEKLYLVDYASRPGHTRLTLLA